MSEGWTDGTVFKVNTDGVRLFAAQGLCNQPCLLWQSDCVRTKQRWLQSGCGSCPRGRHALRNGLGRRRNCPGRGLQCQHGRDRLRNAQELQRQRWSLSSGRPGLGQQHLVWDHGCRGQPLCQQHQWWLWVVFQVNTDGTGFAVLKSFSGSDGYEPAGTLVSAGSCSTARPRRAAVRIAVWSCPDGSFIGSRIALKRPSSTAVSRAPAVFPLSGGGSSVVGLDGPSDWPPDLRIGTSRDVEVRGCARPDLSIRSNPPVPPLGVLVRGSTADPAPLEHRRVQDS